MPVQRYIIDNAGGQHCHRCGAISYPAVARWNEVRPEAPRKTVLCLRCAEREQGEEASGAE